MIQSDDVFIASASEDQNIKIWDLKTCLCVATFTGHTNSVMCVILLDDERIASASADETIRLWDLKKKSCVGSFS